MYAMCHFRETLLLHLVRTPISEIITSTGILEKEFPSQTDPDFVRDAEGDAFYVGDFVGFNGSKTDMEVRLRTGIKF